ncbi:MAG TPA: pitrilysin family protein, partial [Candidatus Polarisedimenticolia bacterium]|nr:pitrilysin family protein [Candidatus Polarisedimenticolia bacterium]
IQADYDRTYFFAEAPTAAEGTLLEGLIQQVSRASLKDDAVERIRPILTRELRTLYSDPMEVLFLEQMRAAFPDQPYRFPYYGNFATLAILERSSAEAFYSNLYAPNNMVVTVGGDISPGRTLSRVRQLFGPLKANKVLPPKPKFQEGFTGFKQIVKKLALPQPSVSILFTTPGYRHPDRYALEVMTRLLDSRMSAISGKSAATTEQLATSRSATLRFFEERGLLAVSAVSQSAGVAAIAGESLLSGLRTFRQEVFPESDVRRAARQLQLESAIHRQSLASLLWDLGESALFGDVRYGWDLEANLGRVSKADVQRVAKLYLVQPNARALLLLPKSSGDLPQADLDRLTQAAASLVPESVETAKPDFAAILIPPGKRLPLAPRGDPSPPPRATRVVLSNGLILLVKSDSRNDLVAVSLQIRAGSAFNPPGKEGLSEMVASAVSMGSRGIPDQDFRERVAAVGSTYGMTTSREQVEAGLTVSPGDLPEALALLALPATDPNFSDEQLARARTRIEQTVGTRALSPSEQARELLRQKLYRGHPYGRAATGPEGSLAAFGKEDLVAFHRLFYRPDRAVLSVVGRVDAAKVRQLVQAAFGGWSVAADDRKPPDLPENATREATAGEFSRVVRAMPAVVSLGFPGVPLTDPQFPLLRALGTILSARGFLDLVLDHPLALSVTAVPEGLAKGGILFLEANVTPAESSKAAYEMMRQARALGVQEVSDETIRDISNIEKGRVLREKEGLYTLASNLAFYELLGAGFAAYDDAPTAAPNLTPASLKEAAARYLDPSRMVRVTAGPPDR